jgi:regulator of sirC expression with transglutaminase-like and TPR domain
LINLVVVEGWRLNRICGAFVFALLWSFQAAAQTLPFTNPVLETEVEALFAPGLDLAEIKLATDHLANPSSNLAAERARLHELSRALGEMAAHARTDLEKLAALKKFIYEPGPWNGSQPFVYDTDDPLGTNPANRPLNRYITSRRGNCVTMPILFAILGERLGLKMTLAEAPLHVFVKYTDVQGAVWNLEATSGAGFTRDEWYRSKLLMTDKAVSDGAYLRPLSREETAGVIAYFLVEDLMSEERYEDAIIAADAILKHTPRSIYMQVKKGAAYYKLLKRDIISKYKRMSEMTPETIAYANELQQRNLAA